MLLSGKSEEMRAMLTYTGKTFSHLLFPLCSLCLCVSKLLETQRHTEHGEFLTEKVNNAEMRLKN
jgi:hypothetical protein